jgi:hypothetical protein
MNVGEKEETHLPFTAAELGEYFRLGMACIGEGSRRRCFQVPGRPFCVKFYRLPSEYTRKTRPSVKLELALFRFSRRRNTSRQEWVYHLRLRRELPAGLFSVFPEVVEPVLLPDRGWGVAESLLLNPDGSPMRRVIAEMKAARDAAIRRELYDALARLCGELAAHAVRFYDPPNVMVQWQRDGSFRLRIVDFEPAGRAAVPFVMNLPFFVRRKVARRSGRYLARLRGLFGLDYTERKE